MSEFGKFSEIGFIDGASPAINADNLNELERVVALTDAELARSDSIKFSEWTYYFLERNTKTIFYFTDYTDWTNNYPANVDLSDEQDEQIIGNDALKMEIINAAGGWLSIDTVVSSTIDLTKFFDGSASTTDDCIIILFYVSDYNAFDALEFRLGDDFANSYWLDASGSFGDGWNAIYPQKSDFTTMGVPTGWNSIDYIRIAPHAAAGYSGDYIYIQYMQLVRQDPVYSGYTNPFQKYMGSVTGWENLFNINNDVCMLYRDHQDMIEKNGFMKVDSGNDETQLRIYNNVLQFISKFEMYCKFAGESASITWYVDSSNFAEVYISSDTLYLDVTESGVLTQTSIALDNGLIKNERIFIYFEKQNDTFRVILNKYGEPIKILEYETSIANDDDGDIYFGQTSVDAFSFLTDFQIGHRPINNLDRELLPRMSRAYLDQDLTSNVMTNLLGLVLNLKPMSYYKVELHLVVSSPTSGKDIKVSWTLTNCSNYSQRCVQGPPPTMTSAADTQIRSTEYGPTTAVQYGVINGNETYIKETMLILCEHHGGTIQIQGAQVVTDAGNATVVKSRSFMIATPLDSGAHENIS